jgi:hypothetical protein
MLSSAPELAPEEVALLGLVFFLAQAFDRQNAARDLDFNVFRIDARQLDPDDELVMRFDPARSTANSGNSTLPRNVRQAWLEPPQSPTENLGASRTYHLSLLKTPNASKSLEFRDGPPVVPQNLIRANESAGARGDGSFRSW